MICRQVETHNGKRDTRAISSRTFANMVAAQLLYAEIEERFLEAVMKFLL